jgi:hypothetical protein
MWEIIYTRKIRLAATEEEGAAAAWMLHPLVFDQFLLVRVMLGKVTFQYSN